MNTAAATEPDSRSRPQIRPIRTVEEFHACEQLQRLAWEFEDDLDVVPLTQLVAVSRAGGLVLGAFGREGELVGFTYAFRGRDERGDMLHSHMTAVHPRLKARGLGARLKWAQRDAALSAGVERIVWTYDPLESLNGYFNFSKLGVVVDTYWEDLYGATGSALHRGMPTDRFLAEWELGSQRVLECRAGRRGRLAQRAASRPDSFRTALAAARRGAPLAGPGEPSLGLDDDPLLVEIPGAIQELKAAAPERAAAWRQATREAFVHYLERGRVVQECVRTRESEPRTFYVLVRREE